MTKSSSGASHVAGGPAKRTSQSGMRFSGSAAGETRRARSLPSRRRKLDLAMAMTFKRGLICTTLRKDESRARFSLTRQSCWRLSKTSIQRIIMEHIVPPTALSLPDALKAVHDLNAINPFGHFVTELIFYAQPQRRSVRNR